MAGGEELRCPSARPKAEPQETLGGGKLSPPLSFASKSGLPWGKKGLGHVQHTHTHTHARRRAEGEARAPRSSRFKEVYEFAWGCVRAAGRTRLL